GSGRAPSACRWASSIPTTSWPTSCRPWPDPLRGRRRVWWERIGAADRPCRPPPARRSVRRNRDAWSDRLTRLVRSAYFFLQSVRMTVDTCVVTTCGSCQARLAPTDRFCPACDAPNVDGPLAPKFRSPLTDLPREE